MKLADLVSTFQWHDKVLFKLTGFGEAEYDTVDFADAFCEIEALQQENEQLQTQNGAMRQQLEIIKANIHEFPPEGMTIGKQIWIETTDAALSTTPTTYHNPADVEALEKAREALESIQRAVKPVSNACDDVVYRLADEALAAIDKIGGREDV